MAYKNFVLTEIIDEIGEELKKARLNKSETLADVSSFLSQKGISLSPTMLGRLENGSRRIDDEMFFNLCKHYEINPYSTVIDASNNHVKNVLFQKESSNDLQISINIEDASLNSLYNNLNSEGQKEARFLLRMMSYMDVFKK